MIHALLIDAGGVLFNNITEETSFVPKLARRYAVDAERLLRAVQTAAPGYERGDRGVHDVLRRLLAEAGSPRAGAYDPDGVDRLYADSVRCHDANVAELAAVARDHPELTLVLANNEAEHWDHLKNERHHHYGLFDHLCSSWRVGRVKPSAAYFAAVLERCGAAAHEALMVDDRAAVVAAARALGLRTLHVTSPPVLRADLRATVERLTRDASRQGIRTR